MMMVALLVVSQGASALETDQYYAWRRPLEDVTDLFNAKVGLEISRVLDEVNRRRNGDALSCHETLIQLRRHFRMFIFHELELWATNSRLIDRIPGSDAEEVTFSRENIYGTLRFTDMGSWIPTSPTIRINDVRIGADKITHFFSEGWWYYRFYLRKREDGGSVEESISRAIERGVFTERTILGKTTSGVFSAADLEANYHGLLFLVRMCEGDDTQLQRKSDGWRMTRPFDFRDYVTPEWDESYQPSHYTRRTWKKVRPQVARHCDELDSPEVQAQRARYAQRDTFTPTERRLAELIEAGKIPDPRDHSIETVCGRN
jgi:hypothetical protein